MTSQLALKTIAKQELKHTAVQHFDCVVEGHHIVLLGDTDFVFLLELTYEPDSIRAFPYKVYSLHVPKQHPCTALLNCFDFAEIYRNSSVLESQEFALEPAYAYTHASNYFILAAQAAVPPGGHIHGEPTLSVLNTLGACALYSTGQYLRDFKPKNCNLNERLLKDVFPLATPEIICDVRSLPHFKEIIDKYLISAFAWDSRKPTKLLYIANAAGYIVAFEFDNSLVQASEYCQLYTGMGRISYLHSCDDLLLAANVHGEVRIFKISHEGEPSIMPAGCLWSRRDRLPCRKVLFKYMKAISAYMCIFTKGSHVLACSVTVEGAPVARVTKQIDGIKITGLESFNDYEFIVTTVTGSVKQIRILFPESKKIELAVQDVVTDLDVLNYQIVGVAASPNRILWTFVMHRNKDHSVRKRNSDKKAYVVVCRLSNREPLNALLVEHKSAPIDACLDFAMCIRADAYQAPHSEKNRKFVNLEASFSGREIDSALLRELHVKLIATKAINQAEVLRNPLLFMAGDLLLFLQLCTRITHIYCRLTYLFGLRFNLSKFQRKSAICMKRALESFIEETEVLVRETRFKSAACFTTKARDELCKVSWIDWEQKERCLDCPCLLDANAKICPGGHKVFRCAVSYVQIPMCTMRFCSQCSTFILDSHELQELYAPGETLNCAHCGFSYVGPGE